MLINELFGLVNIQRRKKARASTAKKLLAGMGIAAAASVAAGILFCTKSGKVIQEQLRAGAEEMAETMKDTVRKHAGAAKNAFRKDKETIIETERSDAETIKDGVKHAKDEIHQVIKDENEKTGAIITNLKDGGHEIKQDIHNTIKHISKELNKREK